jgi:hypothetical protein
MTHPPQSSPSDIPGQLTSLLQFTQFIIPRLSPMSVNLHRTTHIPHDSSLQYINIFPRNLPQYAHLLPYQNTHLISVLYSFVLVFPCTSLDFITGSEKWLALSTCPNLLSYLSAHLNIWCSSVSNMITPNVRPSHSQDQIYPTRCGLH